jgi:hypothetical protein
MEVSSTSELAHTPLTHQAHRAFTQTQLSFKF